MFPGSEWGAGNSTGYEGRESGLEAFCLPLLSIVTLAKALTLSVFFCKREEEDNACLGSHPQLRKPASQPAGAGHAPLPSMPNVNETP